MISQFDDDRDGKLTYNEFLYLVLPSGNMQLRHNALARKEYHREASSKLPFDVEYALVKIIRMEI